MAPIDPDDIAAVAVEALTTRGHAGTAYRLTGGEVLDSAGQVRILGELLGRRIAFDVASEDEAIASFTGVYGDEEVAAANVRALRSPRSPWTGPVPTVADVLGRPPRAFREWAVDNLAMFR